MITKIISGLSAVVILAVLLFWWMDRSALHKQIDKQQTEISTLQTWQDSIRTAYEVTVITVDTIPGIFIPEPEIRHIPMPIDSFLVHREYSQAHFKTPDGEIITLDTPCPEIYERLYVDTLTTTDFKLPFRIQTIGKLKWIDFDKYTLFDITMETRKIVTVEKIVIKPVYKNQLMMYMMFGNQGHSWTEWKSIDVGIDWQHKRGLVLGVDYQRFYDDNFYKFKIGYRLF